MADTYITRSGDQWDSIAYRELGSAEEAARLMEASRVNPSLPPWKR